MEFVRRIYENGKVTIPKEIRELEGIRPGDYVQFSVVRVIRSDDAKLDLDQDSGGDAGEA